MNLSAEHKQLIQNYYDGVLSPELQLDLKQLILENPEVDHEFKTMGAVVESIRAYGFRQMLETFQRRHFPADASAVERDRAIRNGGE